MRNEIKLESLSPNTALSPEKRMVRNIIRNAFRAHSLHSAHLLRHYTGRGALLIWAESHGRTATEAKALADRIEALSSDLITFIGARRHGKTKRDAD